MQLRGGAGCARRKGSGWDALHFVLAAPAFVWGAPACPTQRPQARLLMCLPGPRPGETSQCPLFKSRPPQPCAQKRGRGACPSVLPRDHGTASLRG